MQLPVMPPVSSMLSKSVPTIPAGACYEPKWDGFRSILFRDGDEVELGSRNERPLTRGLHTDDGTHASAGVIGAFPLVTRHTLLPNSSR